MVFAVVVFAIGAILVTAFDYFSNDNQNKAITTGLAYAAIVLGIATFIAFPTGEAPKGISLYLIYAATAVVGYCGIHWFATLGRELRK